MTSKSGNSKIHPFSSILLSGKSTLMLSSFFVMLLFIAGPARAERPGELKVNRTERGGWERFEMLEQRGGKWVNYDFAHMHNGVVALKAHTGYLTAGSGGGPGNQVIANRPAINEWEQWTLIQRDGKVMFKSKNGFLFTARDAEHGVDVDMKADSKSEGSHQMFTLERDGNSVFIKAFNDRYVTAERGSLKGDGKVVLYEHINANSDNKNDEGGWRTAINENKGILNDGLTSVTSSLEVTTNEWVTFYTIGSIGSLPAGTAVGSGDMLVVKGPAYISNLHDIKRKDGHDWGDAIVAVQFGLPSYKTGDVTFVTETTEIGMQHALPEIASFSIDRNVLSAGEKAIFTVKLNEPAGSLGLHLPLSYTSTGGSTGGGLLIFKERPLEIVIPAGQTTGTSTIIVDHDYGVAVRDVVMYIVTAGVPRIGIQKPYSISFQVK